MTVVKDSVDEVIPLVLARADYERRLLAAAEGEEEADTEGLLMTLSGGIGLVRQSEQFLPLITSS